MGLIPKNQINNSDEEFKKKIIVGRTNVSIQIEEDVDSGSSDRCNILNIYGIGGIGKSTFKENFCESILKKKSLTIFTSVNFQSETNKQSSVALSILSQVLKKKYQLNFTYFSLAYSIYFNKQYPHLQFKKESMPFISEGQVATSMMSFFDGGASVGAFSLITYIHDKVKEFTFDEDTKQALLELEHLDIKDIEDRLVMFFAADIKNYIEKNNTKNVIFIFDTYESLTKVDGRHYNKFSVDEWIRELSLHIPNAMFFIFGRERITWQELNGAWKKNIKYYILEELSKAEVEEYLNYYDIKDSEIQSKFIEISTGVPFYLELLTHTYLKTIKDNTYDKDELFRISGKKELFELFSKSLSFHEIETLKVIANTRYFTEEIFQILIQEFNTGYPATAFEQFKQFSFIKRDGNTYSLHDLMRQNLLDHQNLDLKDKVNIFMFEYYSNRVKDIKYAKEININLIQLINEAFYYKSISDNAENLHTWYSQYRNILQEGCLYSELIHYEKKLVDLFCQQYSEEHTDLIVIYKTLAENYEHTNDYKQARNYGLQAYQIAKIYKGHILYAIVCHTLGNIYHSLENNKKAEEFYLESLKLKESNPKTRKEYLVNNYGSLASLYKEDNNSEKVIWSYNKAFEYSKYLADSHPSKSMLHFNYGNFLTDMKDYPKAEEHHLIAIRLRIKYLQEDNIDLASSYNNIASLYLEMEEKLDEAKVYLQKAYEIKIQYLSVEHPGIKAILHNLSRLNK